MVKLALGTKLLRSLVRSGKKQQRSATKLMTTLFAAPKVKPRAAVKIKPKPAPLAKSVKPAKLLKPLKAVIAAGPLFPGSAAPPARAKPARATKAATPRPRSANRANPTIPANSATPAAPGKWLSSYFSASNGLGASNRLRYWLYLPSSLPTPALDSGLPLLVMLHGCHQSATEFAQGTRMNQLAEQKGYAVLYPQQSVSGHAQRCWKWYDRANQDGGGDAQLIIGAIEKVLAQYGFDRSRVYIGGLSAGAGMADIVALNRPDLIAAVGLHSGPVFGAGHSTIGALGVMQHGAGLRADLAVRELLLRRPAFPGMPTILLQGQDDKVVRPVNQVQLTQQALTLNRLPPLSMPKVTLKPAGRGNSRHAYQLHDFVDGRKVMLRVAQIAGLEHAWSGGDPALPYNAQPGPDASKMMLDFFARHRRLPAVRRRRSAV